MIISGPTLCASGHKSVCHVLDTRQDKSPQIENLPFNKHKWSLMVIDRTDMLILAEILSCILDDMLKLIVSDCCQWYLITNVARNGIVCQ